MSAHHIGGRRASLRARSSRWGSPWALLGIGCALGAAGCGDQAPAVDLLGHDGPHVPRQPLVRPDTDGNNLLFRFEDSDVVEWFDSVGGEFRVHYTRDGVNAVPALDDDNSMVPDFVEEVAAVYDEVLDHYELTMGFRRPASDEQIVDNGGNGRFDVYLVDFNGMGDGNYQNDQCTAQNNEICAGYMVQENDYSGYGYPSTLVANQILGSHEFFHAIQAAYDINQGSIMAEGTAVWGTETYEPTLHDFEWFIDGYLDNPDRSLDVPLPGPVDPFSYGSAIFFRFLEERYGDGMIRSLWERCENGASGVDDPLWFTELDAHLQAEATTSFADAFVEFARYNLFTGQLADPARGYVNGGSYSAVKIEPVIEPLVDETLRIFYSSTQYYGADPAGRDTMTAALVVAEGDEADLDGLHMLFAVERAGAYEPLVEVADLETGSETVDTAGAARMVVAVVNTLQAGDSRRPGLCVGSPEEVASCRAAILGTGGAGGGGAGGGGVGGGGEGNTDVPGPVGDDDSEGCGCRLVGPRSSAPVHEGAAAALLGLLGLGAMARRRRLRPRARPRSRCACAR